MIYSACTPCEIEFTESDRYRRLESAIAERLEAEHAWGDLKCATEFLGERGDELYLSVRCADAEDTSGFAGSARVTLDDEGNIAAIDLPRDGGAYAGDMEKLFPPCVRKRMR